MWFTADRRIPAKLLTADPRSGIALLKVDYNSPFIPVGNSKQLSLASPVVAIGFPVNLAATPSFGIVGGFDRQFLGRYFMTTHIRAIVSVEPGFGGAPLMNLKGEVVGIIISGIDGGGACYALPIEAAEKIRLDYIRFGGPRHGWVGANVEDQNEPGEGSQVHIAELEPGTPAAQSGLKEGDIVTKIGGVKIAVAEDVIDASFFLTAGDRVSILIERDGQAMSIDVRPVEHPMVNSPFYPQRRLDGAPCAGAGSASGKHQTRVGGAASPRLIGNGMSSTSYSTFSRSPPKACESFFIPSSIRVFTVPRGV